jgi:hypothetical protein
MGNPSQTKTDDGSGRDQQQKEPKDRPLDHLPSGFTRDPAEGSRETIENNLGEQDE